jgi:DNA-binding LytR/AlgR family response regulator
MTSRLAVIDDGLLVLLCLAIDHRADPAGLAAFKSSIISLAEVSLETEGAFDFIVQLRFSSLLEFNETLHAMAADLRQFVTHYETSFVCKRFVRSADGEECLWVPCADGRQRVDFSSIIKVTAERDYMRVHARDVSWLLHTTIHKMKQMLDGWGFLHIHRSTIVNRQHVERLLHHHRHWEVLLSDGSVEPVSKSHAADTVRALAEQGSSMDAPVVEKPPKPVEINLRQ